MLALYFLDIVENTLKIHRNKTNQAKEGSTKCKRLEMFK